MLDSNKTYFADIDIEGYGVITVKLDQDSAPITTENFVALAEEGFYDGLTFHRIIAGFMMQGGDPTGTGGGGSAESIKGEFRTNGYDNPIMHNRGVISMARTNEPDSAGSQFFIMHQAAPHLDGNYAAFGHVTEGMEIVDDICENTPVSDANGSVPEEYRPVIESVKIVEK